MVHSMPIQKLITRLALPVVMLSMMVTGLVYAAAPMSDSPIIIAFVDPAASSSNRLFAYMIDPLHQLTLNVNLPILRSLVDSFSDISADEPDTIYLNYSDTDAFNETTVARVYRFDLYTGDITTIYETSYDDYLPGFASGILTVDNFTDERHYIVTDKLSHAVILVDRETLDQKILWQGDSLTGRLTNYTLRIFPSRTYDKYAILDDSTEPTLIIITPDGEILNQFQVVNVENSGVMWLSDNRHVLITALYGFSQRDIRVYDTASGEVSPYTDGLRGYYVQPWIWCERTGEYISFIIKQDTGGFLWLTMNLATGERFEQALLEANSQPTGYSLQSNQGCSKFLQVRFDLETGVSDIYQTTLEGENIQPIVSDVIEGAFNTENSFLYMEANENQSYDLYQMSLEDKPTSTLVLNDLPTGDAIFAREIYNRAWYIIREDSWARNDAQFPFIQGDPLLYYEVHSGDARVLTPPDGRVMWFTEVPS